MSWWSHIPDGPEQVEPFTVVLSVGPPDPALGRPGRTGPERLIITDQNAAGRHWMWQQAVMAVLHAVFVRGGSVVSTFDDELFPLLWATALTYAEPAPAEHGARHLDAPLKVIATSGSWYEGIQGDNARPIDSISAFEATGAVLVFRDSDDLWAHSSGRRFGVVLWPDSSTADDLPLMRGLERLAVLHWPDYRVERAWLPLESEDLPIEGDTPPFQHIFEARLDEWLGRSSRS